MCEKCKNGAECVRGIKIKIWIKYKDLMNECRRTKSLLKGIMIVFKTKGPQVGCIPHGKWGLAQCKSTCEEHAGSDKRFENITLYLDQLPLKIQFTKEKRTLKTLVLSREANTLPQCKSSCKEQAGSDKNLSVKPYSLISCCFKHNL